MADLTFDERDEPNEGLVFDSSEELTIQGGDLGDLAQMYREAYDDVEAYTKQLRDATKKKEALAEILYDKIIAEGVSSVKNEFGNFKAERTPACNILPGREEVVFASLEELGQGGLIKRVIHYQTLNKFYRDNVEKHQDLFTTDNFKMWDRKTIRIRRA